jgi:hypothetical protein
MAILQIFRYRPCQEAKCLAQALECKPSAIRCCVTAAAGALEQPAVAVKQQEEGQEVASLTQQESQQQVAEHLLMAQLVPPTKHHQTAKGLIEGGVAGTVQRPATDNATAVTCTEQAVEVEQASASASATAGAAGAGPSISATVTHAALVEPTAQEKLVRLPAQPAGTPQQEHQVERGMAEATAPPPAAPHVANAAPGLPPPQRHVRGTDSRHSHSAGGSAPLMYFNPLHTPSLRSANVSASPPLQAPGSASTEQTRRASYTLTTSSTSMGDAVVVPAALIVPAMLGAPAVLVLPSSYINSSLHTSSQGAPSTSPPATSGGSDVASAQATGGSTVASPEPTAEPQASPALQGGQLPRGSGVVPSTTDTIDTTDPQAGATTPPHALTNISAAAADPAADSAAAVVQPFGRLVSPAPTASLPDDGVGRLSASVTQALQGATVHQAAHEAAVPQALQQGAGTTGVPRSTSAPQPSLSQSSTTDAPPTSRSLQGEVLCSGHCCRNHGAVQPS